MSLSRSLERALKVRLHTQLAADPRTHAWTLSLYRAGEHHPETVHDYFPHEAARPRWPWLAEQLKRHAGDERRHAALYTRAIRDMGEEPLELDGLDVLNNTIRAQTRATWAIRPEDGPDVVRIRIAHFLAHAHHLEHRVDRSVGFHVEACERVGSARTHSIAEVAARVQADEVRHISSTLEALTELTTHRERTAILELHESAENAADLAFSSRQLRHLGVAFRDRFGAPDRAFYRLTAVAMELGLALGARMS
ncbi:MAG: hypothetical protein K1X94_05435 [Sandaracinaceae bacterium]|nr:hypothetical protein [Sandaracinaceae bacterium]